MFVQFKVFLGRLRTVRFTDFLAETVFRELSFFIRNDSKMAFLEKYALFTTQAADNNKVLSEENKEWFENFSKTAYFLLFYDQSS